VARSEVSSSLVADPGKPVAPEQVLVEVAVEPLNPKRSACAITRSIPRRVECSGGGYLPSLKVCCQRRSASTSKSWEGPSWSLTRNQTVQLPLWRRAGSSCRADVSFTASSTAMDLLTNNR